MDAHFVPNLSFGPDIVRALHRAFPREKLDVHLMMDNPQTLIKAFAEAGASALTVHVELGDVLVRECIALIKAQGLPVGLSVKPGTPATALVPYLADIDEVLVMTVEPGFGGQAMMPSCLDKARELRALHFTGLIAADGGITADNAPLAVERGVQRLVMGTALYKDENPSLTIKALKALDR